MCENNKNKKYIFKHFIFISIYNKKISDKILILIFSDHTIKYIVFKIMLNK
jgi:hypothetical protein